MFASKDEKVPNHKFFTPPQEHADYEAKKKKKKRKYVCCGPGQ